MCTVTLKAVLVSLWLLDPDGAMEALLQVIEYLLMAQKTLVNTEKIPPVLVDIRGIRMDVSLSNLFMAVLTGKLPMCRDMEFGCINKPGCPGLQTTQDDSGQNQYYCCYALHNRAFKTRAPDHWSQLVRRMFVKGARESSGYDHTIAGEYVNPNRRASILSW